MWRKEDYNIKLHDVIIYNTITYYASKLGFVHVDNANLQMECLTFFCTIA